MPREAIVNTLVQAWLCSVAPLPCSLIVYYFPLALPLMPDDEFNQSLLPSIRLFSSRRTFGKHVASQMRHFRQTHIQMISFLGYHSSVLNETIYPGPKSCVPNNLYPLQVSVGLVRHATSTVWCSSGCLGTHPHYINNVGD